MYLFESNENQSQILEYRIQKIILNSKILSNRILSLKFSKSKHEKLHPQTIKNVRF